MLGSSLSVRCVAPSTGLSLTLQVDARVFALRAVCRAVDWLFVVGFRDLVFFLFLKTVLCLQQFVRARLRGVGEFALSPALRPSRIVGVRAVPRRFRLGFFAPLLHALLLFVISDRYYNWSHGTGLIISPQKPHTFSHILRRIVMQRGDHHVHVEGGQGFVVTKM